MGALCAANRHVMNGSRWLSGSGGWGSQVTPCPHNPLGVKGAGEAGTITSTACVVNAVTDALYHRGVRNTKMPMTPERVWRALNGGVDGALAAAHQGCDAEVHYGSEPGGHDRQPREADWHAPPMT